MTTAVGNPVAEDTRIGQRRSHPWSSALVVAAAFAILLARRTSSLTSGVFYAEDGRAFYTAQLAHGFHPFDPYLGGVYLTHRIAALAIAQLPYLWAPTIYYLLGCALVVGSLSVVLQQRAGAVFGHWSWRAALLLALVIMPGVDEIQGSVTNVHWWFLVAIAVILALATPRTTLGKATEVVALIIMCLTGFGAVFLIPLAVWAALRFRTRFSVGRLGIVVGCAGLQLGVLSSSPRAVGGFDLGVLLQVAPKALDARIGGTLLFGQNGLLRTWDPRGYSLVLAAAALLLAVVVVLALVDWSGPSPWWLAGGLAMSLSLFAALPRDTWDFVAGTLSAGRYISASIAMIILVLFRSVGRRGALWRRILAGAALIACCVGAASDLTLPARPATEGSPTIAEFSDCMQSQQHGECRAPSYPQGWDVIIERGG